MQGATDSGGLLGLLTGLGNTAANVIGAVKGKNNSTTTTTAAAASKTPAWLMPVLLIGGGILALVLVFKLLK